MRFFRTLSTFVALIVTAPFALAGEPAAPSAAAQQMMDDMQDGAVIRLDESTGHARFVKLRARLQAQLAAGANGAPPDERARAFLRRYGEAFGVEAPDDDLRAVRTLRDATGVSHTVFKQVHGDVPVFGAEVRAHFAPNGDLFAVNGTVVANIKIGTTPRLSDSRAQGIALSAVQYGAQRERRQPGGQREREFLDGVGPDGLNAVASKLMVFREGLVRGTPGRDYLAWEVEVINDDRTVREFIYVDANTGRVIDRISGIHTALDREVSETSLANVIWDESNGDPDPIPDGWAGGSAQQVLDWNNEADGARETYNLFMSMSGSTYDSYDNAGATMRTVNNDPGISCPNANWNGTSTNYCSGVTGDDTVAHEWAHAYTEYTSGLIYQWQSGALNESYSDIWGEVVDLLNGRGTDLPGSMRSAGGCSVFGVGTPSVDNTYRWLSGEDDPAFGGAIRDMWEPTCYGDPGKVSDPEYFCSSADNGGVHFNSGIPNHAFALMVDGGIYNGFGVPAIGLTKAAHIHWGAQNLLTPASNFVDHADALEAACSALIGVNLPALSTDVTGAGNSGEIITGADCAAVSVAIAAVELRDPPTQCGFEPLLEPDAPGLCENMGDVQTLMLEDFEGASLPAGWTVGSRDVANPATFDTPDWAVVGDLPAGADGLFAAFAPDLVVGNCADDDETGAVFIDSPALPLPLDEVPRVAFDHWVATENGWDGGNLKVSVNGGPWQLVPGDNYSFNTYSGTLNGAGVGNTNPLAGEEAFTGADGGSLTGSWGQSQVNLYGLAFPGDTVQLRFELGVDGCNGAVGWYVDNVHAYSCSAEALPVCGDGLLAPGEMCDDGNGIGGDGCSSSCQVESGWRCSAPSAATSGTNVINDGSFEAGAFGGTWSEFSSNFGSPVCDVATCGTGTGTGPSDGLFWTWFGGIPAYEQGSVSQSVMIPATATTMTFDLEQIVCDSGADYMEVLIDGNQLYVTDGNSGLCGSLGYSGQTVDVSAWADGGMHTLEFRSEIFGTNGSGTNFFVDNVRLSDNQSSPAVPSLCEPIVEDMACNAGAVGYDNGIPASWTVVDNTNVGLEWTTIAGAGELGNYTGSDGEAATASSDAFGPADFDTELRSNVFTLKNATSASVEFLANYQNFAAFDFLEVAVSTDNGSTWTNLLSWNEDHGGFRSPPGESVSLDLSPYIGEEAVQLRWRYYDPTDFDWVWYAQIDDASLSCDMTGRMTGAGIVYNDAHSLYLHSFGLSCESGSASGWKPKHDKLSILWFENYKLNYFRMTDLTSVTCADRPLIDEGKPRTDFDTIEGDGMGLLNGTPANISFRFSDAGEPGRDADGVQFSISGPDGTYVSDKLKGGNHQAHR